MTRLAICVSIYMTAALMAAAAVDEDAKWREELRAGTKALDAADIPKAKEHCAAALEITNRFAPDDPRRAIVSTSLGTLAVISGNEPMGEALFAEAARILEKDKLQNTGDYAQVLVNMGIVRMNQVRWAEAEKLFRSSMDLFERVGPENRIHAAAVWSRLGALYIAQSKMKEAVPLLERARLVQQEDLPASRSGLLYTLHALGSAFLSQGQFAPAEQYFQEAWRLSRGYPEGNVAMADSATHLGALYLQWGDAARALPLLKSAEKTYEQSVGSAAVQLTPVLSALARIDASEKRYGLAETKLKRVLTIFEKEYPTDHLVMGLASVNLAQVQIDQKHYEEAAPLLNKGIVILRKNYTGIHPNLAAGLFEAARLHAGLHQTGEADTNFRQAIAGFEQAYGPKDARLGGMLATYAAFLKTNKRQTEAKTVQARVKAIYSFQHR